MLKKLFIHEWKDSWKLVTILNLVVLGLTLIGNIFFRSGAWVNMDEHDFMSTTVALYFLFYVISICSLSFVVTIYFYIRFYHNLYTDQGYLMHTLPVSKHELIWSKALVTLSWETISVIVVSTSLLTLVDSFMAIDGTNLWKEFAPVFEELAQYINGSHIVIILEYILLMLVSAFMSIFMGYASVSLGQLFKKNRVLGACGAYIGLYMLMQMLGSYAVLAIGMADIDIYKFVQNMSEEAILIVALLIILIVVSLVAVAFYFITHAIMKNKLNLE